jgi:hypothetical protein
MTAVRDFLADLARAGKSQKEIKPLVDVAYGDKIMSIGQINLIIKAVKEGKKPQTSNTPPQRRQSRPARSWHVSLPW